MSRRRLACYLRQGFTLIEVVTGLALMGTLLVAILLAHGRHGRQIRSAQHRLAAIDAADRMLADWVRTPYTTFKRRRGTVPGNEGFTWQIGFRESPDTRSMGLRIMRLEIHDNNAQAKGSPLATVDLLVPSPTQSWVPAQ